MPLILAGESTAARTLLSPTPLILKDGRIASVSVHVLPFRAGDASLSQQAQVDLRGLSREVATDCFLTAQIIGHVAADEAARGDTLEAHRLARSRADAVQASLIDSGLPAKSIASVWDWQFMVLEPRATLWVFRLTEGEDCEGTPLEGAAVARAGSAPPPARSYASQQAEPGERVQARQQPGPSERMATERRLEPAARGQPGAQAERPRSTGPTQIVPATSSRAAAAGTPAATQAVPALSPREEPRTEVAAPPVAARASDRAEQPSEATSSQVETARRDADAPAAHKLAIVFPPNSSYFPPGTRQQLQAIASRLAPGQSYRLQLQASVSSSAKVIGATSPAEAAKYNRWLADRRLERVQSWFKEQAPQSEFVIEPAYVADDESRQVIIEIRPAALG